ATSIRFGWGVRQAISPVPMHFGTPHGLVDHSVGSKEKGLRDRQSEGLRSLEVNHQLELRRLLDGQIAGLRALEDFVHVGGGTPKEIAEIRAVAHEAASLHMVSPREKRRQPIPQSQLGDSLSRSHVGAEAEHDNGLGVLASHCRKSAVEVCSGSRYYGPQLQLERAGGLPQCVD